MVEPKTNAMQLRNDIELTRFAQSGDKSAEEVLLDRYQYLARVKARSYFLSGAEHEDTVQEAMIGLYKAIRDFNEEYDCSFRSFAILCVTRQIITAIKTYARKKHNPLSSYQSLDIDDSDEDLLDSLALQSIGNNKTGDPLDLFILKEELDTVITILRNKLSKMEWDVFIEHLDGNSYREIMDKIGCDYKAVDNALCRVREKVKPYLDSPEYLEEELKQLKKKGVKEMAKGGITGFGYFMRIKGLSPILAAPLWNKLPQKEKDKCKAEAAALRTSKPKPTTVPTGPVVGSEPAVSGTPLKPEPAAILPSLLSILSKRPELLEKVRIMVLEELENKAEVLQQKLLNVQKEIISLQ